MKPIENNINFFDLDGVLWKTYSKVWVIDKEDPSKPIIRLNTTEITDILLGISFNDKLKIEYNGEEFYISNKLFNKITKKKKIAIERLGLSWLEYYDEKHINNTKVDILLDNISHLRGKKEIVCILTGRAYQERHAGLLNHLRKKLIDIGIELFKIYFISKKFYIKHNSQISLDKSHVLLEHMIGIKIEDGKFVPKKQDWYSEVSFYDDQKMNIDYANDMQTLFERIMKKTDDELYLTIINRINNNNLKLTTHLVTGNETNRFVSNFITLKEPMKFPIK